MFVFICGFVYVSVVQNPLELKLQKSVSHLIGVLRAEPQSSPREVGVHLNYRTISAILSVLLLQKFHETVTMCQTWYLGSLPIHGQKKPSALGWSASFTFGVQAPQRLKQLPCPTGPHSSPGTQVISPAPDVFLLCLLSLELLDSRSSCTASYGRRISSGSQRLKASGW